ncbi:TPA: hypothetical protein ACJ1AY_001664 [Streptococcus pneumoniae]
MEELIESLDNLIMIVKGLEGRESTLTVGSGGGDYGVKKQAVFLDPACSGLL